MAGSFANCGPYSLGIPFFFFFLFFPKGIAAPSSFRFSDLLIGPI